MLLKVFGLQRFLRLNFHIDCFFGEMFVYFQSIGDCSFYNPFGDCSDYSK